MGSAWSSPSSSEVPSSSSRSAENDAFIKSVQDDGLRHLSKKQPDETLLQQQTGLVRQPSPLQPPSSDDDGGEMARTVAAVNLSDYEFPFENLVFEGGGGKGRIYGGALRCLRDAGIKPRRFAGSSAGAITAALLAVNASPEDIDDIMSRDLQKILLGDSWTKYLKMLPSFLKRFGLFDASGFLDFFGGILKEKTGNADVTFRDIFEKYGHELCVTAVNVNIMSVVYFHPKTTPLMPVRVAVRMSMSIPGLFTPVSYSFAPGYNDSYVDGGVLSNYPIHVFDGWWLSMRPEDSYHQRLQSLTSLLTHIDRADRFGAFNEKTLGFLVYASDEDEIMRVDLDKRIEHLKVRRPDTELFRERKAGLEAKQRQSEERLLHFDVTNRFVKALLSAVQQKDGEEYVTRSDFKRIFAKLKAKADYPTDAFSADDARELFGDECDADMLFDRADVNRHGEARVGDVFFALERELDIHARFLGHERKEINDMKEFWATLLETLQLNVGKTFIRAADLDRTVGLFTDYIGTMDFNVDPQDQRFLNEQGYKTTELFLRDYAAKNKLQRRVAAA